MWMKEDEIIASYRQAKDRKQQVTILSQLNSITVEQTVDIICSRGRIQQKRLQENNCSSRKKKKDS